MDPRYWAGPPNRAARGARSHRRLEVREAAPRCGDLAATRRRKPCASVHSRRSTDSAAMTSARHQPRRNPRRRAASRRAADHGARAPERALPIIKRLSTKVRKRNSGPRQALGEMRESRRRRRCWSTALDQLAAGKVQPGAQAELLDAAAEGSDAPAVKARWEKQQAAWAASGEALAAWRVRTGGWRSLARRSTSSSEQPDSALRPLPQGVRRGWRGRAGSVAHRHAASAGVPARGRGQAERAHRAGIRQRDLHAGERRDRQWQRGQRDRRRRSCSSAATAHRPRWIQSR